MAFIALCLHHYKDMNSIYLLATGSLRMGLFCDIYFYLLNQSPDKNVLAEYAKVLDVSEYLYYCIYYTAKLFDTPNLEEYLRTLETSNFSGILEHFGLARDENYKWDIDFYTRLFYLNIEEYFAKTLTAKDVEKIAVNKRFML